MQWQEQQVGIETKMHVVARGHDGVASAWIELVKLSILAVTNAIAIVYLIL
jgi:hypothetical protein